LKASVSFQEYVTCSIDAAMCNVQNLEQMLDSDMHFIPAE